MLLALSFQKLVFTSSDANHMNMFEEVHDQLHHVTCESCFPSMVYEDLQNNKTYRYPGMFIKDAIEFWHLNVPYMNYSNVQYMLDF